MSWETGRVGRVPGAAWWSGEEPGAFKAGAAHATKAEKGRRREVRESRALSCGAAKEGS
jgi:hypothetical protein